MMPFRLTKQIERLLDPLGVPVLINYAMTHALTGTATLYQDNRRVLNWMVNYLLAIQEEKESVMNALDIFMKEPLMEWRKFASNIAKRQGKSYK
jgi:phosphatidylinositol kinase/protein kinase (PI-3  family)